MGRRLEYEVKTSVRLNMNNPQHVKINNVLQNLDSNIFKSKNQFIIDACQFYIVFSDDHSNGSNIPFAGLLIVAFQRNHLLFRSLSSGHIGEYRLVDSEWTVDVSACAWSAGHNQRFVNSKLRMSR